TTTGSGADLVYIPAPGFLRLWTKQGFVMRNGANFFDSSNPGDYLAPTPAGSQYGPSDLSRLGFSDSVRTVTVYVEAVRASNSAADQPVTVEIDPDGSGPRGNGGGRL